MSPCGERQLDLLFNRSPAKMDTMLMSDIFHRSLIPSPYRLPERALSFVQYVIINWLDIEVGETAPEWRPLLNDLTGWRNREVYYYLQYVAPDWTARMYRGQQTITLFNVKAPSHLKAKWQRLRATGPKIEARVEE
jgi:hypothetical protein